MTKEEVTRSSGNVFRHLGLSPEEASVLSMRADLMARLRVQIEEKNWMQARASQKLEVAQLAEI